MSASGTTFLETREKEYFELLTQEQYEDNIHQRYGHDLTAVLVIASGETSINDFKPRKKITIKDLDNLFNCADGK